MTTALFFLSMATLAVLPEAQPVDGPAKTPPRPPASLKYLWAKAYHIPPETTTEESGYFSLCEGKNARHPGHDRLPRRHHLRHHALAFPPAPHSARTLAERTAGYPKNLRDDDENRDRDRPGYFFCQ